MDSIIVANIWESVAHLLSCLFPSPRTGHKKRWPTRSNGDGEHQPTTDQAAFKCSTCNRRLHSFQSLQAHTACNGSDGEVGCSMSQSGPSNLRFHSFQDFQVHGHGGHKKKAQLVEVERRVVGRCGLERRRRNKSKASSKNDIQLGIELLDKLLDQYL